MDYLRETLLQDTFRAKNEFNLHAIGWNQLLQDVKSLVQIFFSRKMLFKVSNCLNTEDQIWYDSCQSLYNAQSSEH